MFFRGIWRFLTDFLLLSTMKLSRKYVLHGSIGLFLIAWSGALFLFFIQPKKGTQLLDRVLSRETKPLYGKAIPNRCRDSETHAWQMNDDVHAYWEHSWNTGLKRELRYIPEIRKAFHAGELVLLENTDRYFIDTMHYSYAFAKPHVRDFLDTLYLRFQKKLKQTDLEGTRFVVTSLLRTRKSVDRLRKHNRNAIKRSSHLHGTTFDVSYATFLGQRPFNEGELRHLKEALAHALFDLRQEGKCWVKYELFQTCFHVVCKKST